MQNSVSLVVNAIQHGQEKAEEAPLKLFLECLAHLFSTLSHRDDVLLSVFAPALWGLRQYNELIPPHYQPVVTKRFFLLNLTLF